MTMRQTITDAMKQAMRDQDKRRTGTLRLVQAAVKDRDIANRTAGKPEASDDEILALLSKMIKQREESAGIYETNGRPELASQEREEIAILKAYLPAQMDEAGIDDAVGAAIAETGATGPADMGRVMAVLKAKHAGGMDFSKASASVKRLLAAAKA
ncbi:GatB/YqeY domain-containing protein [Aurantimonas sp. Leaf443]|uniref:GatB/YqeY domain-containing protein n=1 Tax=Aurantimonas sp. Leaf443 TaxID=1736378 RepID=UPI0006FBD9EF|nr:GatB/YqeY domain-containing protein [Aurantimonas sp. Leaf443]KQT83389.1 glutamyl-tRNA amidotransferase [Aurantimonas sp. Leaf443]